MNTSVFDSARSSRNVGFDATTFATNSAHLPEGVGRTNPEALIQTRCIMKLIKKESETPPNNVTTATETYVDFEFNASDEVHLLEVLVFEVQYQNADAVNAVKLNMVSQHFLRIEYLLKGSSTDFTFYPFHEYIMEFQNVHMEDKAQWATQYGVKEDTDFSGANSFTRTSYDNNPHTNTIAASGTASFFFKLNWPWRRHFINLAILKEKPRIRFYFNNTNMLDSTSVSTTVPHLLALRAHMYGPRFASAMVEEFKSTCEKMPAAYSVLLPKLQSIPLIVGTANQEVRDISLTGVSGRVTHFYFYLEEATASKEGKFCSGTLANPTWRQISEFSIKKPDGTYESYERMKTEFYRSWVWNRISHSQILRQKPLYYWTWSRDPIADCERGETSGFYQLDNRHSISITPTSTSNNVLTPGVAHYLQIVYFVKATVHQNAHGLRFTEL